MARINQVKRINVATASFPYTINLNSDCKRYKLYGSLAALASDYTITYSGTPVEGMSVDFDYNCTVTTDGSHTFVLFGTRLPQILLQHKVKIHCEYSNSAWTVFFLVSWDAFTGTAGSIVVVGTGGISPLAPGTAGKVVIDSGTAFAAVALTGDITVSGAGATAIGANKILASMIKAGEIDNDHIKAAAAIAVNKLAALTASKAVITDSNGFLIPSAVTPTELGYLAGVTSAVQDQIDGVAADLTSEAARLDAAIVAATGLTSHTVITTDTTATAAALKSSYIADTSGGAVYLTLPLGSTLSIGATVKLLRIGGNDAGLVPGGSDKIYPATSYTSDAANVKCSGTGKSITAVLRAVNEWQVIQAD